jgi:hypothetical protein
MLDKAYFEKRIEEIKKAIEMLVSQHNAHLGHLAEAQFHLNALLEAESKANIEAENKAVEEGLEHAA